MNGPIEQAILDRHWNDVREAGLRIAVAAAVGHGQTLLSAFDDALFAAGIHGFNLITLSSVIPAAATVLLHDRIHAPANLYGHKAFVVRADARSADAGSAVVAGLGWFQGPDAAGIFVEHHAVVPSASCSAAECDLQQEIVASLEDLAARRAMPFAPHLARSRIVSAQVANRPTCALVVALYQAEGWGDAAVCGEGGRQ